MNGAATHPPQTAIAAANRPAVSRLRRAAGACWMNGLFFLSRTAPWFVRLIRPIYLFFAWHCSPVLRGNALANSRRILGEDSTPAQRRKLAQSILANVCDVIADVGRCSRLTPDQLRGRIESIEGDEHFRSARAAEEGAIIATAHLGRFEAAVVALRDREPHLHVVFQRDAFTLFDRNRSDLHRKLGVVEAPIDDGWTIWMRLRDALQSDQVVLVQADRVMPGQKGQRVPFLGGHILLPTGPVKLALATGAPLIPVFALRTDSGGVRIHVEPAIYVQDPDTALIRLAAVIEKYVRQYPDQWLVVHKAWCEDQPCDGGTKQCRSSSPESA